MDQYVDAVLGLDANSGLTTAAPKRTLAAARAALGGDGWHNVFAHADQVHLITSEWACRSGASATQRFTLRPYGTGAKPIIRPDPSWNPSSSTPLSWQFSGARWITVEDIVFDAEYRPNINAALTIYITSALDSEDIVYRRCEFIRSRNGFVGQHNGGQTLAAHQVYGLRFEECDFRDNLVHGQYRGFLDTIFLRCRFFRNGSGDGGHGASVQGKNFTQVTNGWTLVAGTAYKRPLAPDALAVWTSVPGREALVKNTTTPGAPLDGQWGTLAGELYVNTGGNPNGATVTWTQIPQRIWWVQCEFFDNYAFHPYPFVEGQGVQFDDYTHDCHVVGGCSWGNDGQGAVANNSADCSILGLATFGNARRGYTVQYSSNIKLEDISAIENNQGGLRYPYSGGVPVNPDTHEIGLFSSPGTRIRGAALRAPAKPQAIWVNDARSVLGSFGDYIAQQGATAIYGGPGGALPPGTNNVSPATLNVDAHGRLLTGSILVGTSEATLAWQTPSVGLTPSSWGPVGAATLVEAVNEPSPPSTAEYARAQDEHPQPFVVRFTPSLPAGGRVLRTVSRLGSLRWRGVFLSAAGGVVAETAWQDTTTDWADAQHPVLLLSPAQDVRVEFENSPASALSYNGQPLARSGGVQPLTLS
jgi:hypothetical protein